MDETETALGGTDTVTSVGERAPPMREPARGDTLGRYVVLARLGAGGMGVVLAAYDPELDRKVALKLVRDRGSDRGHRTTRLQREAQAMAKLSHPNVIPVHDVGLVDEQVFIAMEFVDGQTLTQWLASEPRPSVEQVVDVFVHAGAGLQAAHAAGLVHRDFKPDNVLIGKDGRIRVMDFGLARTDDEPSPRKLERTQPSRDDLEVGTFDSTQTAAGTIMGTPAYMAPEQHLGERADARSDQFSFCVALFEGLYQRRPFRGDNLSALVMAVVTGKLEPPPKTAAVPTWLRAIVLRGLETNPDKRFASMQELLAAIEAGRRARSRKRVAIAATAGVALFVGLLGLLQTQAREQVVDPCAETREQFSSAWDQPRREAVGKAFADAGLSERASARAIAGLDRYAEAWTQMRADNCSATQSGAQSDELMDLRSACLDRRRTEVAALVELLEAGNLAALGEADENIDGLMPLAVCADEEQLRSRTPLPSDASERAAIEDAERLLADAQARLDAGLYADVLAQLDALAADGPALAYAPVAASAGFLRGRTLVERGEYTAAEPVLQAASLAAARAHDDRLQVQITTEWMALVGTELGKVEQGDRLEHAARVALLRLGDPQDLRWQLDLQVAKMRRLAGQPDVALEITERITAELAAAGLADSPLALKVQRHQAILLANRGRYDQAELLLAGLVSELEQQYGPDHPALVTPLTNLAAVHGQSGDIDRSKQIQARVLELAERRLGPLHPSTGVAYESIGVTRYRAGDHVEARAPLERAVAIYTSSFDGGHPSLVRARGNLAAVLIELGELATAEQVLVHSRDVLIDRYGREHDYLVFLNNNLADLYVELERYDEALAAAEWALQVTERKLGSDSERYAECLIIVAHVLARRGELEPARARAEQALELLERIDGGSSYRVTALAVLGYVLVATPGERAAGERRFAEALALATSSGPTGAAMLEHVRELARERGIDLAPTSENG